MASVDVMSKFTYLEHGNQAPRNSSYTGIITTASIIGWRSYTERKESRVLHADAIKVNKANQSKHDQHSFFNYTSERIGSTSTYSSIGWIENEEKINRFKDLICEYFCENGDLIWTPIISLKDYMTAAEMKMYNEKDYAAVIDKILPRFFKEAGFENDNVCWWMDYHVNTDNPHVHLSFFEKTKTINHGKLAMKEIEKFKKMFWNEVFAKKRFLEKVGKDATVAFKDMDVLKQSVYKTSVEKIRNGSDESFIDKLKDLAIVLPESGRLQYGSSHMIPYREQLDQLVEQLLHTSEVNEKYREYKTAILQFDDVRNESLNLRYKDSFYKTEDSKLRKTIANAILNEMKRCNGNFERTLKKECELLENAEYDYKLIPVAKSLIKDEVSNITTVRIPGYKSTIKIPTNQFSKNLGDGKLFLVRINRNDEFELPLSKLESFDCTFKELKAITYDNANDYFSDGKEYIKNERKKVKEIIEFADLKRGNQHINNRGNYTIEEKTEYQKLLRDYMRNNGFSINEAALIIPVAKSLISKYDNQYSAVRIPKTSTKFLIKNNRLNDLFGSEKIFLATINPEDEFEVIGSKINYYDGKMIQADSLNYHNISDLFSDGSEYFYSFAEMIKQHEEWLKRKSEWTANHHDWKESAKKVRRASFAWMNEVEQKVREGQLEYLYGKELDI